MKPRVLVFDFDGTLADTFHSVLSIVNGLAAEFNFKRIEWHEAERLRDRSWREILRYLEIPVVKVPFIVAKTRRQLFKEIEAIRPVKGIREVVVQLKSVGHEMGILSSNSFQNVMNFLGRHEMACFDFISTSSKVWGKRRQLQAIVTSPNWQAREILYIGDEVRDIEAAQAAGVEIAAVTWGYNSRSALEAYKPDYLVTKPEELLQICGMP